MTKKISPHHQNRPKYKSESHWIIHIGNAPIPTTSTRRRGAEKKLPTRMGRQLVVSIFGGGDWLREGGGCGGSRYTVALKESVNCGLLSTETLIERHRMLGATACQYIFTE